MSFNVSSSTEASKASFDEKKVEEVKEKQEGDNRVQVKLPLREGNKEKFESLGIEWVYEIEGNPFTASAKLPSGWTVRDNNHPNFDMRDFVLIDAEGMPKATVTMKMAFYDQYAFVNILSAERSLAMKEKFDGESEFETEFQRLLGEYQHIQTMGCGARAQPDIDRVWAKLEKFGEDHPEFKQRVPSKQIARNDGTDGTDGMSSAILMMANSARENGDGDCSIQ